MKKLILAITAMLLAFSFSVSADTGTPVKMMTYNIMGTGISRGRIANIAKVIKQNQPDVIAIQEINNKNLSVLEDDEDGLLAQSTGLFSQFHPLVGNYYGIGILSKTKPLKVEKRTYQRLSNSKDRENRGVIIAEFDTFYFISSHFSLDANDRDVATADIIDFAQKAQKPVFLAADFNAKPTYRCMVTLKKKGFKILNDIGTFTYPSDKPTGCIDMILGYDPTGNANFTPLAGGIAESGGINIEDENVTSDHLPVFVTLPGATTDIQCVETAPFSITANAESICVSGSGEGEIHAEVFSPTGTLICSLTLRQNALHHFPQPLGKGIFLLVLNNGKQTKSLKLSIH